MELRHLRYFVAVAEELHFGRAATRLHMAQPPLSQQIRQLETEMGVLLFERTNRSVELTPAGADFFVEAQAILEHVDRAVLQAQRSSRGERGWLGVGFVGSATYDVLPTLLRRFREAYPEVELTLVELTGEEQEWALREKRIHVGLTRVATPAAGVLKEELLHEPLMLAVSANHALAKRKKIALRELADEPFVLFPYTSTSSYGGYLVRVCQAAGFTPRTVQNTGEMQTAISLVSAGIGVTLVPAAVQNFQREGVAYRPLAAPAPTIPLTLLYREVDSSPVLPHFIRLAREVVREMRN